MATILIAGFGPGISTAVAEKFGAEGFSVALVARNADRLSEGVKALEKKGIKAAGFKADLGDPAAVKDVVAKAGASLGPIGALLWTAYGGPAGDFATADAASLRSILDIAVVGLVTAVQAALPDLKKEKNGAVLVVNGGLGRFSDHSDELAVTWNSMGAAVACSAKHKTVRLLSKKLKPDGVYVGEVTIVGTVKGTAFDHGKATIESSTVAAKFWEIYTSRNTVSVEVTS